MTKNVLNPSLILLLSISLAGLPMAVTAKDTNAPAAEKPATKEAKPKKSSILPIHGKLKALDKTAKTVSIGEHTLQITSETLISKEGKPATLEEGVIDENVTATYKKSDDGKLNAVKLSFGKAEKKTSTKAKKEKAKQN